MYALFRVWILLFIWLYFAPVVAQSPYDLQLKRELIYTGTGIRLTVWGTYLKDKVPLFTPDELMTLDPQDVNGFDRIATGLNSTAADTGSDVALITSFVLPALFLSETNARRDFPIILALWGEVVALNRGATLMLKHTLQRPRPLVFNDDVPLEFKQADDARASFISGHTSKTAANAFFVAKVFADYYPDSRWKPVVWTAAATLPALNAFLRVRAGKHYPTDVIAGYAVGAAIGVLVPHLHRRQRSRDFSLSWGLQGMHLRWRL